jgi:hypothetical protein
VADRQIQNLEHAAEGHDFVEDFGEQQRIDDVAAKFNGFGRHRRPLESEWTPKEVNEPLQSGTGPD